ncbi:MAG: DUF2188 domain-containing protein [Gemmatimonadota bacterium]
MARVIYEVAPHERGQWHIRRRGTSQLDSIHNHKADAVTRARRLCRAEQRSQLVIRRRDSTIEFVRTYGDDRVL